MALGPPGRANRCNFQIRTIISMRHSDFQSKRNTRNAATPISTKCIATKMSGKLTPVEDAAAH